MPPGAIPQAPIIDTECHDISVSFLLHKVPEASQALLYDLLLADRIPNGINFMIMIAEAMNLKMLTKKVVSLHLSL